MNSHDVIALLPLISLAAPSIAIMLQITIRRHHGAAMVVAVLGLAVTLATLVRTSPDHAVVGPLLTVDNYARFFIGLIVAATLVVTLLSYAYLKRQEGQNDEYYLLLVLAALGSSVLAASSHFASFFLGLEILSVALYALIAYRRTRVINVEAGIKYLILAGVSSAFLLFGMALMYSQVGTMELGRMASALAASGTPAPMFMASVAMILVGVGFKLAVVPFHLWTPDIYEGAPAPVTAFIATVSKGAVFALLLRYSSALDLVSVGPVFWIFWLIAVASMIAGNFLALRQSNVKRILAYSSIANLGYLLVPFLAGGPSGETAAMFYLVAYFATTLSSFGVVTVLSNPAHDADSLDDYRGLFWRRPWLATMFTSALLSLAGIPLTAGFVAKFYAVATGAGATLWALVVVLVLSSAVGLYYYLRIIVAMYSEAPEPVTAYSASPALAITGGITLSVLTLVLIWLGVYPSPLLDIIRAALLR